MGINALPVMPMLTLLEIIRVGVVVMGIGFTDMMPSLIPNSHSLSPLGREVALQHWI